MYRLKTGLKAMFWNMGGVTKVFGRHKKGKGKRKIVVLI
jgi:hypothetical protein